MRKRCISLVRVTVNALNPEKVSEALESLAKRAIGKTFSKFGWVAIEPHAVEHKEDGGKHVYSVRLCFSKRQMRERTESDSVFEKQAMEIIRRLVQYGRACSWEPAEQQEAGTEAAIKATAPEAQRFDIELPEVVDVSKTKTFSHIYGRNAQIRVIFDAIKDSVSSRFKRRGHCALFGPAGCGKSETLTAFEQCVGPHNVLRFNAETTSKAGLENELLEYPGELPRFLILEEAEKCAAVNLSTLLAVLDTRAVLKKSNAKVGSVERECRSLMLCTVNDMALFKTVLSGAIASRFANKIYFPRPDEKLLARILHREIQDIPHGDSRWIRPILRFMAEEGTNDPRRGIALLSGGKRIMDGSFFRDQREILRQQRADEQKALQTP